MDRWHGQARFILIIGKSAIMTIPTIQTERLLLRAFTDTDTDRMFDILSGKDVLRYFPPNPNPITRERAQKMITRILAHWEERSYGLWAVTIAKSGQLLGRCGLQYIPETNEVEVDFILDRDFWGHGYATEAGVAALKFGFDNLEVSEIIGLVHPDNIASQRVLQKIGMQYIETKEYFGMNCQRYVINR